MITELLIFLVVAFTGYLIGRVGDFYLNPLLKDPSWAPHHWIYGILLVVIGLAVINDSLLSLLVASFGVGHFISDFKDFADLKFIGSDKKQKIKFWDFD